jgi:tRNA threonylcarbamoyladenosine biosynthesis protein TsaE
MTTLRSRHWRDTCPVTTSAPQQIDLPDADATREFGRLLAQQLRAGDLVMLTGDLGAGKTTLTQGIGAGLGVRGHVASPTFIIARVHPSLTNGPALVHVDAYRLGSLDEVDALDLDASIEASVTIVEWGQGLVESIARDRLEITIRRPRGADDGHGDAAAGSGRSVRDDAASADGASRRAPQVADLEAILADAESGTRRVTVRGWGDRWADLALPGMTPAPITGPESVG